MLDKRLYSVTPTTRPSTGKQKSRFADLRQLVFAPQIGSGLKIGTRRKITDASGSLWRLGSQSNRLSKYLLATSFPVASNRRYPVRYPAECADFLAQPWTSPSLFETTRVCSKRLDSMNAISVYGRARRWLLTYSANALFIRVCHPGPDERGAYRACTSYKAALSSNASVR